MRLGGVNGRYVFAFRQRFVSPSSFRNHSEHLQTRVSEASWICRTSPTSLGAPCKIRILVEWSHSKTGAPGAIPTRDLPLRSQTELLFLSLTVQHLPQN